MHQKLRVLIVDPAAPDRQRLAHILAKLRPFHEVTSVEVPSEPLLSYDLIFSFHPLEVSLNQTLVRLLDRRPQAGSSESAPLNYLFKDEIALHILEPWVRIAELQKAENDGASLAPFASVTHELRTPLVALLGFAESILEPTLDLHGQRKAVTTIIESGRHLLRLIDDLLTFSRIEAGKLEIELERCNLFNLIEELEPLMRARAATYGNVFSVEYAFPLPQYITTDATRVKQVLLNLLGNAIKFTEQGMVALVVSCIPEEDRIFFDVIDTGVGIRQETLDKLFTPFTQGDSDVRKKFGGSGLGLAISKSIAAKLGGRIKVDSREGRGSVFTFSVPAGPFKGTDFLLSAPSRTEQYRTDSLPQLSGKVLVVEDTPAVQEFLTHAIGRTGVTVDAANDGFEALKKVRGEPFDLVFMDLEMPRMNGLDAISRIRSLGITVPIVSLSAYLHRGAMRESLERGATGFLSKTCELSELYAVLGKYLSRVEQSKGRSPLPAYDGRRMAKATLSYIVRVLETVPFLKEAARRKDWKEARKLNHGLIPGKMFGYELVTEAAREVAGSIEGIARAEHDILQKVLLLEPLVQGLRKDRELLEAEFIERTESATPGSGNPPETTE